MCENTDTSLCAPPATYLYTVTTFAATHTHRHRPGSPARTGAQAESGLTLVHTDPYLKTHVHTEAHKHSPRHTFQHSYTQTQTLMV